MSALIVTKRHIDFLVAVILRSEAVPEAGVNADHIGQVLWHENHKSVNFRHNEQTPTPEYRFEPIELPTDVGYLLAQVDYYQYQSCERYDWPKSKACHWTERLRKMWVSALRPEWGADYRKSPGYAAAPWGVDNAYTVPAINV